MKTAYMIKKSIIGLFLFFWGSIAVAQSTTLWVVRHAEKDTAKATLANPDLSEMGKQRALDLAAYLKKEKIALIYSTDTKRTKQTAAHFTSPMEIYNPKNLASLKMQVQEKANGKTILLVGHSNTVLETIEALGAQRPVKVLNDDDYDYIFKVVIGADGKTTVEAFQFGKPHRGGTPAMR
jgi:broad specificity phosphatase PhoE